MKVIIKKILINSIYYPLLFIKYSYIYTHNCFTWLFNKLAQLFNWNVRFYYAREEQPDTTLQNRIKAFFRFNKADSMAQNYKQLYEKAQAQSDRNFARYQHRKKQEDTYKRACEHLELTNRDLNAKNQALQQQINDLMQQQKTTQQQTSNSSTDHRSAMEILRLKQGFTQTQLKTAYKTLNNLYHPDKHLHMSAEFQQESGDEFKKIQTAYSALK